MTPTKTSQTSPMNASAVAMWEDMVYKKISHKLRLHSPEHEETQLLRLKADQLRAIRKKLLRERCD